MSELARDFVLSCLAKRPEARPSIAQLLRHPWVRSYMRRRSGRVGGGGARARRGSFETVRLPTGALADVFASRVDAAAAAAAMAGGDGDEALRQLADGAGGAGSSGRSGRGRRSGSSGGGAGGGDVGGGGLGAAHGRLVASLSLNRLDLLVADDYDGSGGDGGGGGSGAAASAPHGSGGAGGDMCVPSLATHDALADGSLTAALIAAGAFKAPAPARGP